MKKSKNEELQHLYDAHLRGKPGAEDAFLDRLYVELSIVARRYLGRRRQYLSDADRADVEQDLLIEIWLYDLERFDPKRGSLIGFLAARVRWRLSETVQRLARDAERHEEIDDALDIEAPDLCPERQLAAAARERRLSLLPMAASASLKKLSDPPAVKAVQVHDIEGRSLCSLASRLHQHPSTTTRARKRGLAHLRDDIELRILMAA